MMEWSFHQKLLQAYPRISFDWKEHLLFFQLKLNLLNTYSWCGCYSYLLHFSKSRYHMMKMKVLLTQKTCPCVYIMFNHIDIWFFNCNLGNNKRKWFGLVVFPEKRDKHTNIYLQVTILNQNIWFEKIHCVRGSKNGFPCRF